MDNVVKIDYLIVANHAEVINGLLYLSGGGFTDVYQPATEATASITHFCAALSILIPQDTAHQRHTFTINLINQESKEILASSEASFSVNKPLTIEEGTEQHVVAVTQFNIMFPTPGFYRVEAIVDNRDAEGYWKFRVHERGGTYHISM